MLKLLIQLCICLGICDTNIACKTTILHTTGGGSNGGGGGGGRIAVHYTGDHYYNGQLLTHGGQGNENHGGPGTMYLAQVSGTVVRGSLTLDNARLTTSQRIGEVEKLDLAGRGVSASSTSFTTYSGIHLTTTGAVYGYYFHYYDRRYRSFYYIRSGGNKNSQYYQSAQKQATITVELPFLTYIDHIVVYPHCDR